MITDKLIFYVNFNEILLCLSELASESTNAMCFRELMSGACFHLIHSSFVFSLLLDLFSALVFRVFKCDIGFKLYSVVHLIVTLVIFVNNGLSDFPRFFGGRDTIDVSDCGIHGVIRIQRRIHIIIGLLRLCET